MLQFGCLFVSTSASVFCGQADCQAWVEEIPRMLCQRTGYPETGKSAAKQRKANWQFS
jgi:hypothetical protein